MSDVAFERKLFGVLALYMWLGSAMIMECMAVWPRYEKWFWITMAVDIAAVLVLISVPRIKKCKIKYAELPMGPELISFFAGAVVFLLFSAIVAKFRGVAPVFIGSHGVWNCWPWGFQGVIIWSISYWYWAKRKQKV